MTRPDRGSVERVNSEEQEGGGKGEGGEGGWHESVSGSQCVS